MNIIDMHIHANNTKPDPEGMLQEFDKLGISCGCVFSNCPDTANKWIGTSYEERLEEVLGWARGHEDRIFPVLWIHPYEENIIEKVHEAVDRGICAFKIICTDFFVYEEQCLKVLREIASLNKPVFFHSGILWDGMDSSKYNRPLNWEALVTIEGLRFSMGHCSWPWIDECVALYGKFLNSLTVRNTAEMFFDITPGTPEIYREELFRKLYNIGYDVGHNIMFGTDSSAECYKEEWAGKWLSIDGKILDKLGISKENRENLYRENILRFLGKSDLKVEHVSPVPDNAGTWSAQNPEVKEIIAKWYETLKFPHVYDKEFRRALAEIPVSDAITLERYDSDCLDGRRNLLSFLYLCEEVRKGYEKKGIPEEIMLDTLNDLVIWTEEWSNVKGTLYLGELDWIKRHMSMNLFRLGRLQFAMGKAEHDIPKFGVKKGESVLEVHIPENGSFTPEECEASFEKAKKFFATYYPEFEYKCFTCHSWLLDPTLKEFLSPESNIIKFQDRFTRVHDDVSEAILRYVFQWNTTSVNLKQAVAASSFAAKIKKAVMSGKTFYETFGAIEK